MKAELARALATGVSVNGQHWRVTRAWPASLDDSAQGYVLELAGADGRVRGARLRGGLVELGSDGALPALDPLIAQGWSVVAHRLGKRAVLRRNGAGNFRKLATPKATKRAVARADAVERLLGAVPGVPRPPGRVGVDTTTGTIDLAPAPGIGLRTLLTDPATTKLRARAVGRRLGDVLASLATIEPASGDVRAARLPEHRLTDEVAVLERWIVSACSLAPLSADDTRRLWQQSDEVLGELARAGQRQKLVLSHRDLHDGQVLVAEDGTLTLLDWDTAAWAEPCLDPANLLAHFDLLAEQRPDAAELVAAAAGGLHESLAAAGHPAASDAARLELLRRASAVRIRAVHAFRSVPDQ
ncbi:MAG: phosphotransferase [Propionibacteriaceae bacterium]|nr:phosphotransferase [Propionibacteriaceae bacterium]